MLADVIVAEVDGAWRALPISDVKVTECKSVDPTRRVARIDVGVRQPAGTSSGSRSRPNGCTRSPRSCSRPKPSASRSGASTPRPSTPKVRVQFGRPIGQFQGVKHRCADMLARTELARAAVWDAARAVARGRTTARASRSPPAAALAFDAAFLNGKDCIQTLGGIGFTWEHDAHIYLRRAMTLHQLVGSPDHVARRPPPAPRWHGGRRSLGADLPAEAEAMRAELRAFLDGDQGAPSRRSNGYDSSTTVTSRRRGRARGVATPAALELLVIEEEFRAAKVVRPGIMVGAWALPNLIVLRHARAAGPLDPADAAGRHPLVPAVQRTGRRLRPRVAVDEARRASTAAGCSTVRRCGRRPRRKRNGASVSPAPIPTSRSTTASRASWST